MWPDLTLRFHYCIITCTEIGSGSFTNIPKLYTSTPFITLNNGDNVKVWTKHILDVASHKLPIKTAIKGNGDSNFVRSHCSDSLYSSVQNGIWGPQTRAATGHHKVYPQMWHSICLPTDSIREIVYLWTVAHQGDAGYWCLVYHPPQTGQRPCHHFTIIPFHPLLHKVNENKLQEWVRKTGQKIMYDK